MTNLQIHLLLTRKIINHMLTKLKTSVWNFHSDTKFLMNISEQKWHQNLSQPINMTNDFKVDVMENILGSESFVEMMNLVNAVDFFALNKKFNFLLPERKVKELSYQSNMRFSPDKLTIKTNLNATKDADQFDDISAWQQINVKAREHLKELTTAMDISLKEQEYFIEKLSFVPEPPNPRKDVAIVKASDIEKLTRLKKILDPVLLSDKSDELPITRIFLHELNSDEKPEYIEKQYNDSHEIIFDKMKIQVLVGPNSMYLSMFDDKN